MASGNRDLTGISVNRANENTRLAREEPRTPHVPRWSAPSIISEHTPAQP